MILIYFCLIDNDVGMKTNHGPIGGGISGGKPSMGTAPAKTNLTALW